MNGKTCQLCQQKPARLHITQIINHEAHIYHFCADCALEYNLNQADPASLFAEGGPGAADAHAEDAQATQAPVYKSCPFCEQTYKGFQESGRLGCPRCYDSFAEELIPLLRRIQSGLVHKGGKARSVSEKANRQFLIQQKREMLRQAVGAEDFESAAKLRDEIRSLEKQEIS